MRTAFLALAGAALLAQQEAPKPGAIEGVIHAEGTGEPVAGVDVWVGRSETSSDASGKFEFRDVAPGRHEVRVGEGFRSPTDHVTKVVTVAPAQTSVVNVALSLRGVISGRVTDTFDEPVQDADVVLLSCEYVGGTLRHYRRAAARTDDLGRYRIEAVRPGVRYIVVVQPREQRMTDLVSDAPSEPRLRRPTPVPTYFPGVASIEGATPVVLRSGEHRVSVDVRMLRAESFCIEAQVGRGAKTSLQIHEAELNMSMSPSGGVTGFPRTGSAPPDGRVRVCDLHPGEYRLTSIDGNINKPDALAVSNVTIGDRDQSGISLHPLPKMRVPVEFVWAGAPPASAIDAKLRMWLVSRTRSFGASRDQEAAVSVPGTSAIKDALMDEYDHRVAGLTGRLYVKEVLYGAATITRAPIRIGSEIEGTGVRVAIGHDGAFLKARAVTRDGKPLADTSVVIMPEAFANEGALAAAMRHGRTDQAGEYSSTRALAPGKYYALALNRALHEPVTPEEIAALAGLRNKASEVSVEPGAADVELRLEPVELTPLP